MNETAEKTPEKTTAPDAPTKPDPKQTCLVRELKHTRGMMTCRWSADGKQIFAGGQDEFVHRWELGEIPLVDPPVVAKPVKGKKPDLPSGPDVPKSQLAGHDSWVQAMALSPDGKTLVTGDYVGRVVVWSLESTPATSQHVIEAHVGSVRAVAISPDGKSAASAGNDGAVRVWSLADGARQREFLDHGCHVYNTAFHPDGGSLISADLKGVIRHFDLKSGELVRKLDAGALWTYSEKYTVDVGGVRGMTFSADGSQLACAGATGDKGIAHSGNPRVLLFDWKSGSLLRTFRPEKEVIATAWSVRFHPDGYLIAAGGSRTGGYLWFFKPDAETEFHNVLLKARGPGFDFDLAADQTTLAVAQFDGGVRLYQMATPKA